MRLNYGQVRFFDANVVDNISGLTVLNNITFKACASEAYWRLWSIFSVC